MMTQHICSVVDHLYDPIYTYKKFSGINSFFSSFVALDFEPVRYNEVTEKIERVFYVHDIFLQPISEKPLAKFILTKPELFSLLRREHVVRVNYCDLFLYFSSKIQHKEEIYESHFFKNPSMYYGQSIATIGSVPNIIRTRILNNNVAEKTLDIVEECQKEYCSCRFCKIVGK